jgi:regulator of protease activity HflC (stomatin/prohibitin superfamily)
MELLSYKMANELTSLTGNGPRESKFPSPMRLIRTIVLYSFLAITALIHKSTTFFVVPSGMVGIVVTFGHVKAYRIGFPVKAPLIYSLDIFLPRHKNRRRKHNTNKGRASVQLAAVVLFRLD